MNRRVLHLFEGYGIELEYMIVRQDDLVVAPLTDQVIHAISGSYDSEVEMGELNWSNELVLHVIELKTHGPAAALEPLPDLFQRDVRRVNDLLRPLNAQLMPTAMHPWMDPFRETRLWPHENSPIYDAYNRIFGCQGHGWSNLQSLHINVPFADDAEFGKLHAAIRLVLPLLPAIAASSPIMDGGFSGLLDSRLEVYRHNQEKIPAIIGQVIPEPVYTQHDYETQLLASIYKQIAPHDPDGILQEEWLNSRGAIARFDRNTIEIRVLDIQECPLADLAIAALTTRLLQALTDESWAALSEQQRYPTESLADLFFRAIRDAEHTMITDARYLRLFGWKGKAVCSIGELWQHLFESHLRQHLDPGWHSPLNIIFQQGPLARRIVNRLRGDASRSALTNCYRELIRCLQEGRLLTP